MKKIKKIVGVICLSIALSLIIPLISSDSLVGTTTEAATMIKLNKTNVYVSKGDTVQLYISGTTKKVKWSSSNKKIATINAKGKVRGIKKGKTSITASVNGKKYTCKVNVEVPAISKSKISLGEGSSTTLKMKNTKQKVKWISSNKKVAIVSAKGIVKGLKDGTATITAKVGNKKYTCKVTVKRSVISVKTINLDESDVTLCVGESKSIKATVYPSNASNKTVIWSSSDVNVATVDNGVVSAVASGTATITATVDQKRATCSVTIYDGELYIGAVCALDFAYQTVKFPDSIVFTNLYYTNDNGAGNELWLIEGYGDNSLGGKSYFYVSAMRADEVDVYPIEPYKYYSLGSSKYIRTVASNQNPYSEHMEMFSTMNKKCAVNEYYKLFESGQEIKFD